MSRRLPSHLFIGLISSFAILACISSSPLNAREIGIAFIEDRPGEPTSRLANLIIQELQPLLDQGDTLAPVFLDSRGDAAKVQDSLATATADPNVEYVIATGLIGSQELYLQSGYSKPTWALRVLDPGLTGVPVRDKEPNLHSYSAVNEIEDVFNRVSTLFQATQVGIILPTAVADTPSSIGNAVITSASKAGITVQFLPLDFTTGLDSQLPDVDAVILPPAITSDQELTDLLQVLRRKRIPSFAVGGDRMVISGALISDTLDADERIFARRVALDLQLAITGDSPGGGMRLLQPKKRTTINIDTARALDIDFSLDELLTARIVQGSNRTLALGLLSALELATDRNPGLLGQFQQLRIDEESLEQARTARRPQLTTQLGHTRHGEQLPEQDSLAALNMRQILYSPSANATIRVAERGLMASEKSLEQKQLDTIQQTATAYFQALQAQARFDTTLRELTLNRKNLILAEQRKASGSGAGADIYRWQAIIAASETAALQTYTSNTRAQNQLARLLNMRLQVPTRLTDVDLDQPPFDLLHEGIKPWLTSTGKAERLRQACAARALSQSPLLARSEAGIAISDTRIKALRQSYYIPEISLNAQYARHLDSSVTTSGLELDNQDDWSVMLKAELPLILGGSRRSLIRQYAAESALAETELQNVRISIWANAGNAVDNLVANYRAIELSDQAEAAALKSQQITRNAYRLGAASVTDLLDTQNTWREAQDNAHIARYQYLTALVDFQSLMGEMPMLEPGAGQLRWLQALEQSMLEEADQSQLNNE